LAATAILAGLLLVVGYVMTPGVEDAGSRARAIAVNHGGRDVPGATHTDLAGAVVGGEGRRFYTHGALDGTALGRAIWARLDGSRGDPGGSTIAQQLARLLYGRAGGVLGPIQDTMVAFKLERRYSKDAILEMYLTATYYGQGAYGAEQAAATYFHKPLQHLDWAEATMLAGLPQAPSAFDPLTHFSLARGRQRDVLNAVVRSNLLSPAQADAAFRELRSLGD